MQAGTTFFYPSRKLTFFNIAAAIIIFIAVLVILGWLLDIDILPRLIPGTAGMKFNTAFCFLLCGVAFLLLLYCDHFLPRVFFRGICLFVIAFALFSLSQDVFHWSAGIDE